jgi:hypothetical protein
VQGLSQLDARLPLPALNGRGLEPPYISPYQVLARKQKTLQLRGRGKPVTVSTGKVKPAYIFDEPE